MKAIIYTRYGSPDVLEIKSIEKTEPKNNEIRLKIYAAEATKSDCELRSFNFAVKWFWLPLRIMMGFTKPKNQVLGGYFSGKVEKVGKDVSKFKIGDQVCGSAQMKMGAYAEYLCLPEDFTIIQKPNNMNFEQAAAIPLGGLNALHYLRKAKINKGDKVLINGAGASIGTFAVQIAKSMDADVTAVDSGIKEIMLRNIGADHFIDYTKQQFTDNKGTYDVIFNMVAGISYSRCLRALKPNGRYLMANPRIYDMLRSSLTTRFTDKTVMFSFAGEKKEELLTLKEMIEEGKIKPIVDKVYPMEQASEAHRRVEMEQRLGSIVISIS